MPIDIVNFRGEDELKELAKSQAARFEKRTVNIAKIIDPESTAEEMISITDAIVRLDQLWRETQHEFEMGKLEVNKINKEIAAKAKQKLSIDEDRQRTAEYKIKNAELEKKAQYYGQQRDIYLARIGNIVHDTVPIAEDEALNTIVRTWGTPSMKATNLHHHHLLHMIDGYASDQGVEVAGHRGYYLTEYGLLLNQALIRYGLAFLRKRQYKAIQPPFFMRQDIMAQTAQLEEFDEALYKVQGEANQGDMYLIATSEQPISAFHRNEWMDPEQLPIKYAGISSCFRKEAGSHGKDAWGIFRVHQFEKVEQFVLCNPEESWEMLETMVANSEEFIRSLGIPYRVVNIVSGALNNAAAKKFDIEAWFPTLGVYRELVSCSNCTDYQSRGMETRYGLSRKANEGKKYVHMLNGTLCATTRTLCCILENYQTDAGIVIPEVLRPYMDVDLENWTIPYTKAKPEHEAGIGGAELKKRKQEQAAAAAQKK